MFVYFSTIIYDFIIIYEKTPGELLKTSGRDWFTSYLI